MAKRINDTQVRKQQILEAASALFLENGYAGEALMILLPPAELCGEQYFATFTAKKNCMTRSFLL